MTLLSPSPGEVADRLSILALKVRIGREQDRSTTHWEAEAEALVLYAEQHQWGAGWPWLLTLDLAGVNGRLWRAEDDLRECRQKTDSEAVMTTREEARALREAYRIQTLNDERAALIRAIDRVVGVDRGMEKLNA